MVFFTFWSFSCKYCRVTRFYDIKLSLWVSTVWSVKYIVVVWCWGLSTSVSNGLGLMMDDGVLTGEWLAETWWCEVTREGSVGDWMAGQRRGCGRGSPRTTCLRTSRGPGPVVLRPARTSLMAGRSRARHSNDATYLTTMTAPACGVAVRSLHDPRCQVSWPTHTRCLHSPPSPNVWYKYHFKPF